MATIPLRTYFQHIDRFIEQKQLDEAIAHCKHILSYYPKSLETYRLMGKALLEKSRYGDAADIFQRVLSSVPDDFISHIGMAIVREDEGNLEAALWHMERAFESNPANGPAQEELRRLYGRRDGVVPARAQLTRGALARMYVRGELYPQAELELRSALKDDPERMDLSLLLARVLLETGHRMEAAELAQGILQKIPYGYEALRIILEIFAQQNRTEEGRFYHQRLVSLDPYEGYANGHSAQTVSADAVRIPELGEAEGQEAALKLSEQPDWVTSLGETLDTQPPAETSEVPDWLKTGTGVLTGAAALTDTDITSTDLPAAGEVPDWLKDVEQSQAGPSGATDMPDWMKATTGIASGQGKEPSQAASSLTNWLATSEQSASPLDAPAQSAEMPDWLKDIAPPTAPLGGAAPATQPMPDWLNAASEPATPAWMTGPLDKDEAATTPIDSTPDWLKDQTGALSPEAAPVDDLPDWLKTAAAATGPITATGAFDNMPTPFMGGAEPDETPEWLKTKVDSDELPDWLKNAATPTGPLQSTGTPPTEEPLPGWLKSTAGAVAPSEPLIPSSTPEVGDELPEWMKAAPGSLTEAQTPAVELPEFLQPASAEAIERANTPVNWDEELAPPTAEASPDAVPDWIKAMAPDVNAAPVASVEEELPSVAVEDLPDWLRPAAGLAAGGGLVTAGMVATTPPEPEAAPSPAPAAPETPDLGSMNADEAMAWLEGLAAKQGADAETLITKPEERTETPPAWLTTDTKDVAVPTSPVDLPPWAQNTEPGSTDTVAGWLSDKETPDWLRALREEGQSAPPVAAAEPAQTGEPALPDWLQPAATVASPPTAEVVPAATPDLDSMSPDEALKWLEGLAANQGANPEELITVGYKAPEPAAASEPPAAEATPVEDMPDWLKAVVAEEEAFAAPKAEVAEVAPAQPVAEAAPTEDMPDWLKAVVAEEEAFATPKAEVATPAPVEAAVPDLNEDDALKWLESLAAKQGAEAETLITRPEDRVETPPAWVSAAAETGGREGPIMPPTGMLPDIFGTAETKPAVPAAEPLEIPAVEMNDDDALKWLESLAAKQGAEAETLITQPEERVETPPAWVAGLTPASEAIADTPPPLDEPAPEPITGPPDWVKAAAPPAPEATPALEVTLPPVEPEPPAPAVPAATEAAPGEPIRTGDKRLSQLASKLAADRRSRDEEIAARFERERAEREKAQQEVMEKMEQRRVRRAEAGTGTLKPATGMLKTSVDVPTVKPVPPTDVAVPTASAAPAPEKREAAPRSTARASSHATRLTRSTRKTRRRTELLAQPPTDVLAASRQHMLEGQYESAAEGFGHLISQGHMVSEVITELEAFTASRPAVAPLYRTLGDAYMRAGKLQRALDAYRAALTQM